jgi:hypothetical protein
MREFSLEALDSGTVMTESLARSVDVRVSNCSLLGLSLGLKNPETRCELKMLPLASGIVKQRRRILSAQNGNDLVDIAVQCSWGLAWRKHQELNECD